MRVTPTKSERKFWVPKIPLERCWNHGPINLIVCIYPSHGELEGFLKKDKTQVGERREVEPVITAQLKADSDSLSFIASCQI